MFTGCQHKFLAKKKYSQQKSLENAGLGKAKQISFIVKLKFLISLFASKFLNSLLIRDLRTFFAERFPLFLGASWRSLVPMSNAGLLGRDQEGTWEWALPADVRLGASFTSCSSWSSLNCGLWCRWPGRSFWVYAQRHATVCLLQLAGYSRVYQRNEFKIKGSSVTLDY